MGQHHLINAAMSAAVVSDECAEYNCTNCKAPCCGLHVTLTPVEHESGVFITTQPLGVYILAQKENGACIYQMDDGRCSIYHRRPYVCRTYTCEHDKERITDKARFVTGKRELTLDPSLKE